MIIKRLFSTVLHKNIIIIKCQTYLFPCIEACQENQNTVMIPSVWTDRPGQTVQTPFRLQSDQGLHCLQLCLHLFDTLL